jgi:aryl-alcohol dehydrogenase-like predicted oxidoreductase
VRSSIDSSLQRLQTDHVDVYTVHWPDRATPFAETMGALDDLVREGKIRFVGVSNFTVDELAECMEVRRVDVVQYVHGLFDRRMERDVLPWCRANDVAFVGYGSLAYGLLSGTLTKDHEFPADDWRSKTDKWGVMGGLFEHLFGPGAIPRNVAVVDDLQVLAADRGMTVAQLALHWAASTEGVSAALVGCRSVAEIEADVDALALALDAADREVIDAAFADGGVDPCPSYWIERGI